MLRHVLIVLTLGCGASAKKPAALPPAPPPGTVTAEVVGDRFEIVVTHGDDVFGIVDEPAGEWDVRGVVEVAEGSNQRVVIAQKFNEVGEDEFSREVKFWVVDASRDKILWQGTGSYSNSADRCETIDVPWATVQGGEVVVTRSRESTAGCEKPSPLVKTVEARVKLD